MDQDDGWDLPDLQFLGGVSVGFAVSAEHLIVVGQLLFLGEQLQTILLKKTANLSRRISKLSDIKYSKVVTYFSCNQIFRGKKKNDIFRITAI